MRAFLSHGAPDKPFVDRVAQLLGRQYVVFDRYEFKTGDDFRDAIRKGLAGATVFSLFASAKSVTRDWVRFELREAEMMLIRGNIDRVLVLLLEPDFDRSLLPEWLNRSKQGYASSPEVAATIIRSAIRDRLREDQRAIFVGRSEELAEAERLLVPVGPGTPPRVFLLYGLPGIGRKTVCTRLASNLLSYSACIVFPIEDGDGLVEIALKLAAKLDPFATQSNLAAAIKALKSRKESDLIVEIVKYLKSASDQSLLPVFEDAGGLIDGDGALQVSVVTLLNAISGNPEIYLALISRRLPKLVERGSGQDFPCVRVNPLRRMEVERLLTLLAQRKSVTVDHKRLSDLAEYVHGFPPAAYYALELVKRFGVDQVLADKRRLVEFTSSYFLRTLITDPNLTDDRKRILSLLAVYSPLPLQVIGLSLRLDVEKLALEMQYLLECAFVSPDEQGDYELSAPLIEAVARAVGLVDVDHASVARTLYGALKGEEATPNRLALSRHLFRAATVSDEVRDEIDIFALVADLIRLAKEYYHARDYENCIKFGEMAVKERPRNVDVRSYIARAYAQNEKFEDAHIHANAVEKLGNRREAYFLRGFINRFRGNIPGAIDAYETALRLGRSGVSVHRELAGCYFRLGDYEAAQHHIALAQERDRDNRYVVDLQIQIAVERNDESGARKQLDILRSVDREAFFYHRASTVEYAFGNASKALAFARQAFGLLRPPTVPMYSQLIKCLIEEGALDEADKMLVELGQRHPRTHTDIKLGLACKLATASGEYPKALELWDKLEDKTRPVHRMLRLQALDGLVKSLSLMHPKRASIEEEIEELREDLKAFSPLRLLSSFGSDQ